MMDPVVSTEFVASQIGKPGLVVFDATKYLPNENKDGHAEYLRAHIPGARFFDIDVVADQDTDLPHMVPSGGRFAKLMEALGVANDSAVVFYDQKGLSSAARGWWLMGLFGHDNAAVLEGGLPKWLSEGRPTEAGEPAPVEPGHFTLSFRAARLRGIGDIAQNLQSREELVLDARAAGRFRGEAPEPRPGIPSGHIPGSRNVPYTELLYPDHSFLPVEAVRARFAREGVDGTRPVVTTCGTGVSAAILTLAMVRAGLPPGALYDGSWTEWGGRPDTPKER
jgi:thiosulfate/3-mercaptopyruvate sulfurtransferase